MTGSLGCSLLELGNLLELMSAGLLYVLKNLAVELFFGILDL